MRDVRVEQFAEVLVGHSLQVKRGENVVIRSGYMAKPLIDAIYRKCIDRGANAFLHVLTPEHTKYFIENANDDQMSSVYSIYEGIYDKADAVCAIDAAENIKYLTNVDPKRNAMYNKLLSPVLHKIMSKRWVTTNFPTQALAQEARMSLEEYEDFVYGAALVDYQEMDRNMDKITAMFDLGKQVRLVGRDTDLTFSIEGRNGIKCSGQNNVPDGEVYYAPITNSANGHIYYEYPASRYGVQVDSVRLEFKDGKIVSAKADRNEEFLNQMLDTDEGARFIGEFGIGVNYGIKKFTNNILFDEKIGGTIHLAAGNAYEGSGGDNKSTVHWDMIKELRDIGEIYLDGKLVQKNGLFLID